MYFKFLIRARDCDFDSKSLTNSRDGWFKCPYSELSFYWLSMTYSLVGNIKMIWWRMVQLYICQKVWIILLIETNFAPKIMINKKFADRVRNFLFEQNWFIHTSQSCARIRKLPVHDHMTRVVRIDILTGHEEKGNLHFILKIIFHCTFTKKNMHL